MILLDYIPDSGSFFTWHVPGAAGSLPALQSGRDRLFLSAEPPAGTWVDHAAVTAMREQRAVDHSLWLTRQPGPEPWMEPDWSACLRNRTASPSYLAGAGDDNALSLDLITADGAELIDVPPHSELDIRGETSQTVALPGGEVLLAIGIGQPGTYHLILRSARHLTQEWIIHAS
ncbi:MAG: hypothetical protein ACPG43_09890 [Alcanivoracaceae bacterium]